MDLLSFKMGQKSAPAPEPVIEPLSVTENGTYEPEEGVDGYAPVTVDVSGSGGSELVYTATIHYTRTQAQAMTEIVFEFEADVEPNYLTMLNESKKSDYSTYEMIGGVLVNFDHDLNPSQYMHTTDVSNSFLVFSSTPVSAGLRTNATPEAHPLLEKNGNAYKFTVPSLNTQWYKFGAGDYVLKAYHIDFPTA